MSQIIRSSSSQQQAPERPSIPRRPKNFEPNCIISPESSQSANIPQQSDLQNETYKAPSAIYEEIKDDIVSNLKKI